MENPNSVHHSTLNEWAQQGVIEWWGQRDDMPEVLAQVHIVCLPSYREGLPKVLLEAAACGIPMVTTDAPGCREVVRHGVNGLLVPVKSVVELADALQLLIESPDLRQRMGARGREIAVNEFAVEKVVSETMAIYEELLCK
jgi:glycosyltransferase involved in cell wall biosynthesis